MRWFFPVGWREKNQKMIFWFTIIAKYHKNRKGYIIMEIMSTNVIISTRYRGEKGDLTTYYGVCLTKGLHNVFIVKCRKVWYLYRKIEKA